MNKRCVFFLAIVFSCYHTSYGQNSINTIDQARVNKNAIQVTGGFAGLMGAYNMNYERKLVGFEKGTLMGLWSKVGFGGWGVWSTGGPYQSATLGILTGAKKHHFELTVGGARMFDKISYEHAQHISAHFSEPQPLKSDYVDVRGVGTAGYRYQKPDGNFLFRCGIGYPETVFVGLGIAF
ncbi:hypothetical protein Q4E40_16025 [Pontibacter sp. BT731]|uniref:hypothetical protein n=1 Tax=Pontibacter coccineus TaxID=3063328 RepID=UPI0026E38CA7|nr:hypothetical protein [Pontibacter sp. BT731]MDO6391643.1 hypothetical protein [Pontibacter sp. BT731]